MTEPASIRQLPFGERLAEHYPKFADLSLREAGKELVRRGRNQERRRRLSAQKHITSQLIRHIGELQCAHTKALVQIGANDGEQDDPIHDLLTRTEINAVLVEPLEAPFQALVALRGHRPNTQLVNKAISQDGSNITLFVPIIEGHRRTAWATQSLEQALELTKSYQGNAALLSQPAKVIVPSLTPIELLTECGLANTDVAVLVCDIEGHDDVIVRSFLEISRPEIIFYEQQNLPERPASQLRASLGSLGYRVQSTEQDVLAVL